MALTFPLDYDHFQALFYVATMDWTRADNNTYSGTDGSGSPRYVNLAQEQYTVDVVTQDLYPADFAVVEARLEALGGGARQVLVYDKNLPFPSGDPDGSLFGAATPAVNVITDRSHLSLTGFPNSYAVKTGEWLSIKWDTSRYFLTKWAEDAVSHASTGALATTEVSTPLPEALSSSNDVAITVIKPPGKFTVLPESIRPNRTSGRTRRMNFTLVQTHAQ